MNPLILTLLIDQEAFIFFNSLRKKYFPASRNVIDAHLTLFHALPNDDAVARDVRHICIEQTPFQLTAKEVVSIGNGVAYKLESGKLMKLHKTLQDNWDKSLSLQDQQKLWPHITVQNKVSAQEAHQLKSELEQSFTPFDILAEGLQLWEYLNGPWKLIEQFSFNNNKL